MVHLARVPTSKDIAAPLVEGLERVTFDPVAEEDATVSVYGSRYAAQDLPKHEMPEREMPKEV
jgi:glutamate decarboxylase